MEKNIKKLKVLEICPYSAGGCGVWARAKQESLELLKRGYDIMVFSSNLEKGTCKIMPSEEKLDGLKIKRFPAKKLGGESFMLWLNKDVIKRAIEYSPDIIITHTYRHLHTTTALKIKKILEKKGKKCKIFLITHAPFVEGNITRSKMQTAIVNFYDFVIGRLTLNKFDKILAISKWEIPYLLNAGARRDKVVYIPNGIPDEFFTFKSKVKEEAKAIFLGRISPKKKIETIIQAIPFVKDKKFKFEIIGPSEEDYKAKLVKLIAELNVESRIVFSKPIYDLKEKIKKIDSSEIYILASRVEGMPQGLIEAMAREKIVIGSNSIAIRDLIEEGKNGYMFKFDNPIDLARTINLALSSDHSSLRKEARNYSQQFIWNKIIKKIIAFF